ncbi:MAG: T9SS type A sorting domain-containing protein [Bacteroidia bacterium]
MDLQHIIPGIYVIRITSGKLVSTQKLVIAE